MLGKTKIWLTEVQARLKNELGHEGSSRKSR